MGGDLPVHSNAENGEQWNLVDIHTVTGRLLG